MTASRPRSTIKTAALTGIAVFAALPAAIVAALFAVLLAAAYFLPTDGGSPYPSGFTPIRDDTLAARFAPVFIEGDAVNPVRSLYYRAARSDDGSILIAYHPVWAYEKNETGTGAGPILSRWVYTGGLSLQRLMFGKGDVETIAVRLDSNLAPVTVWYEYPASYSVNDFSVRHATREAAYPAGGERLAFAVVSWNHLFDLAETADSGTANSAAAAEPAVVSNLVPEYFSDALWTEYAMVKTRQTRIRKNRAHYPWERRSAE